MLTSLFDLSQRPFDRYDRDGRQYFDPPDHTPIDQFPASSVPMLDTPVELFKSRTIGGMSEGEMKNEVDWHTWKLNKAVKKVCNAHQQCGECTN